MNIETPPLPSKTYDIIYMDPPWSHYGSPSKMAAAGKHYQLMKQEDVKQLPIKRLLNKKGACFVWATGPRLHYAIEAINAWGLHYRGVAHIWVKTRKDGKIIHAQGIPPTYSKPTSELLLLATTNKTGRPFKLLDSKIPQIVLAPRENHSKKPDVFRQLIERAYGKLSRLEMFARGKVPNWNVWGVEAIKDEEKQNNS